ncbi:MULTISPECIES: MFS transporter [Bacillaceae]|uniref:MFS transporter n=1 Tax=Evansella alkalicola TaxID=745819 RepID=A0ABS6JR86_9BACI|nr:MULTISPECIES: MFS transporter [Bacillaceae]MBU9721067.1 MFS transporter [Bacillus alkalicola]
MTNKEKLWSKGFIIITISCFLLFLNMQMLLVTTPVYLRENFQSTDTTIGVVTSLFAFSAILARIYTGRPSQMHKIGKLLFVGLCIAFIATVGIYWSYFVVTILLIRMLHGLGFGIASTTLPTMASNLIPHKRMGEGMGYFGFSNTLALMLGPVFGLFLLDTYSIKILILVASIILVVVFPLIYKIMPRTPIDIIDKIEVEETVKKKKRFISRNLLVPAILNVLMYSTYSGLVSFIVLFGQEQNLRGVSSFFLFSSLAVLLVRPFAGRFFDKKGPLAVLIPGAIFMFIGLILLSFSTNSIFVVLTAFVYGIGYGILQPTIQAWMINKVSKEERGLANGMFFNSLDLGVVTGAVILGAIASSIGYVHMYQVSALFMVLFLIVLVVSVSLENRSHEMKANHDSPS